MEPYTPEQVEALLQKAGRTLMALRVSGCWPASYRSGQPDISPEAIAAEFGARYITLRTGPDQPLAADVTAMDRIFNLVAVAISGMEPARIRQRQIVLRRCLQHPDTERQVFSDRRLGVEFATNGVQIKRIWDSGVAKIAHRMNYPRPAVCASTLARIRAASLPPMRILQAA